MNYPFVTFKSIDGVYTYTKCVKYLTLQVMSRQKSDTTYWIDFDKKSIGVSQETYREVDGFMAECNRNFDRARLNYNSASSMF
jgi:hypothetical protein